METKYFLGKDGKIYTDTDIKKALFIVYGEKLNIDILDLDLHKYRIIGIDKPINPTVEDFIYAGQKVAAVRFYYIQNQPISIRKAKDYVDDLELEILANKNG